VANYSHIDKIPSELVSDTCNLKVIYFKMHPVLPSVWWCV